jgi:hypothetical protein
MEQEAGCDERPPDDESQNQLDDAVSDAVGQSDPVPAAVVEAAKQAFQTGP